MRQKNNRAGRIFHPARPGPHRQAVDHRAVRNILPGLVIYCITTAYALCSASHHLVQTAGDLREGQALGDAQFPNEVFEQDDLGHIEQILVADAIGHLE